MQYCGVQSFSCFEFISVCWFESARIYIVLFDKGVKGVLVFDCYYTLYSTTDWPDHLVWLVKITQLVHCFTVFCSIMLIHGFKSNTYFIYSPFNDTWIPG